MAAWTRPEQSQEDKSQRVGGKVGWKQYYFVEKEESVFRSGLTPGKVTILQKKTTYPLYIDSTIEPVGFKKKKKKRKHGLVVGKGVDLGGVEERM